MRGLAAVIVAVLLGLVVAACGGWAGTAKPASQTSAETAAAARVAGTRAPNSAQAPRDFRGDEDDDEEGEEGESRSAEGDSDADFDNDSIDRRRGYRDGDDGGELAYGHAPNRAEKRLLTAFVRRYYAAGAAGDGATACRMIAPGFAGSVVEAYGGPAGPVYLQGAKTCAAVLSRLFEHFHAQLAAGVEVTGVRVGGAQALVFVGSGAAPAGALTLERRGRSWGIVGMLATELS